MIPRIFLPWWICQLDTKNERLWIPFAFVTSLKSTAPCISFNDRVYRLGRARFKDSETTIEHSLANDVIPQNLCLASINSILKMKDCQSSMLLWHHLNRLYWRRLLMRELGRLQKLWLYDYESAREIASQQHHNSIFLLCASSFVAWCLFQLWLAARA